MRKILALLSIVLFSLPATATTVTVKLDPHSRRSERWGNVLFQFCEKRKLGLLPARYVIGTYLPTGETHRFKASMVGANKAGQWLRAKLQDDAARALRELQTKPCMEQ